MQDSLLIPYDETADVLFKRGRVRPITTGLKIFDTDLPGGLKYGDVVELYGQANVGKTEFLYQLVASCVLPRKWKSFDIGGNDSGVVYFDNDYHFCMTRLVSILEFKIRSCIPPNSPPISTGELQDVLLEAMKNLHIFRCRDSLQFLASIQSLHVLLDHNPNIKLLLVDSISCFYWLNKYEEKEGARFQRQITSTLKRLLNSYTLLLFATKGTIAIPKEKEKDGSILHKEYLGVWDIVKYRVILSHPLPTKKDTKPPFIAKVVSPHATQATSNNNNTFVAPQQQATSTVTTYKYIVDETGLTLL